MAGTACGPGPRDPPCGVRRFRLTEATSSRPVAVQADSWLGQGNPSGDRLGAFAGDLFEQHSEMVLGVCRLLLADPVEAEDAMQQTFFSAYRSIVAGSEPQRPAAWLATIARNECLDRIRARRREPLAERVLGDGRGAPDALNVAIAREDLRALGQTIKELPTQQRKALLLHEFHGLPYRDVAAAIGVSESAIASLLFRARARLRSVLHGAYAILPVPTLWNVADRLAVRAPAIDVGALPVVAKLGTAALAVGLATGTAIVIEHDVNTRHAPPPSAQVPRPSASPVAIPALREAPRQGRLTTVLPPVSRSETLPHTGRGRSLTRPPAPAVHRANRSAPATSGSAPHPSTLPASLGQPRATDKSRSTGASSSARKETGPTSAHHRTIHSSPPGNHAIAKGSHDRSPHASPPEKSARHSATPNPVKQASPPGPSSDNHSAVTAHGKDAAIQNAGNPQADGRHESGAESNADGDQGAGSSNAPAGHQGAEDPSREQRKGDKQ